MVTTVSENNEHIQKAIQEYEQKKINFLNKFSPLFQSHNNQITLQKKTSNLFRNKKTDQNKIDLNDFNRVIYVDETNLIAEIEGLTTYEDIVKETLKYNCLPAVIPELKSITIGGALAGVGIESSSFRYGLVHETLLEYEILLGDGRIVLCQPNNAHEDLYYAFPNTYGTLGYALKVKVKLIPIKKYVKLTHIHFNKAKDYFTHLKEICAQNKTTGTINYIDGVVFNKNELYITLGEFVDVAPFTSNYKYLNIYYRSIKNKKTDYLNTNDYIWRWDTDWFWCSKHFFMQNFILRVLFGKFLLKSTVFWKIRQFFNKNRLAKYLARLTTGRIETVIQDIEVPIEKSEEFLTFFHQDIGIKPIWICPIMPYQHPVQYSFYKMEPSTLYINFGFWDVIPTNKLDGFYNKKIEKKVRDLSGNKSLYSSSYYTLKEFWEIYDQNLYLKLKEKYDPFHNLNNLYEKCVRQGVKS